MQYAAININFDSLSEAYGFPQGYRDPSFFEVADRFFEIAKKYNFKYSIYVIGKDLEVPAHRARVAAWARDGHEIGNHSWSHRMDLGVCSAMEIEKEVTMAHERIRDVTGKAPQGFIAPAWNSSAAVRTVLASLGYQYDTSSFPSWVLFPAMIKNIYNYIGSPKVWSLLRRRDGETLLWGSRIPHYHDGMYILPIPTNQYRIACWHTLGFLIGWNRQMRLLRSCLRAIDAFYYLVHPADCIDRTDLDVSRQLHLERLNEPVEKKIQHLERAIETILASGRKIVTMRELAERCRL